MPLEIKISLLATLLAIGLISGAFWKISTGRARRVRAGEQVDLGKLAATKAGKPVAKFGKKATLLQFSSQVCSQCGPTARYLDEIAKQHKDLLHIEVDVTNRIDLAAHFGVLQTPTTLVLDNTGRVKARIGGAPKPLTIKQELEKLEIK